MRKIEAVEVASGKIKLDTLIAHEKERWTVIMDGGESHPNTPVKQIILNSFFWKAEYQIKFPITSFYIQPNSILTSKFISNIFLQIYNKLLTKNLHYSSYEIFSQVIWKQENDLMNFIMDHCFEYAQSINIIDLAKFKNSPEFQDYLKDHTIDFDHLSQKEIEQQEKEAQNALYELIMSSNNNPLKPYLEMGMLNITQVFNIFMHLGFRTDIDDKIIPYYIKSSLIEGIQTSIEYTLESLAAKKTAFYNTRSLSDTRYFERLMQIVSLSVSYTYEGFCGSNVTIPFKIEPGYSKNFIGMNIRTDDGQIVTLLESNIKSFLGKTVNLMSAITCRHTDGVCETCLGRLAYFFPRTFKVGMVAATEILEPISQKVLSAKHFQQVLSVAWKSAKSKIFSKYFRARDDGFYMREGMTDFQISVSKKVVKNFLNLGFDQKKSQDITGEHVLSELDDEDFIKIKKIGIFQAGKAVEKKISLTYKGLAPVFTPEFAMYLAKHPEVFIEFTSNDVVIDLKGYGTDKPFMKVLLFNDSMVAYVESVQTFVKSEIKKFTSASSALYAFSDTIWKKVNANLALIAVILKCFLVTNERDVSIPEITNVNDVKFEKLGVINMYRSLGSFIPNERHSEAFSNPLFFMNEMVPHPLDPFVEVNEEDKIHVTL